MSVRAEGIARDVMRCRYIPLAEACARTNLTPEEMKKRVPVLRLSQRMWRVLEQHVEDIAAGKHFSWTIYRVEGEFPELHARRPGTVYFIEAIGTDRVKIGYTSSQTAEARLRDLQTAAPFELRLLAALSGSLAVERYLHRRFASERILPCAEWFHLRGDLATFLDRVRREGRWP